MRAAAAQKEPGGLFSDEKDQTDLMDLPGARKPTKTAAAPERKRGTIGMMVGEGEVYLTSTGRETTPVPKIGATSERKTINAVKRVEGWLMQNALDEARSRGDDFNARMFEQNLAKPSQSDKDSAELYLFDDDFVQPVPKSILKPISPPRSAARPSLPSWGWTGHQGPDRAFRRHQAVGPVVR